MKGGYPEGVAYSILIIKGVVPLKKIYNKPKKYFEVKSNEKYICKIFKQDEAVTTEGLEFIPVYN